MIQLYEEKSGRKTKRANLGNGYFRVEDRKERRARGDEMEAQRVRAPKLLDRSFYSNPLVRKRTTGSTTGTACRLKIQRATANPSAA
jgi:hypothetical protein